MVATCFSYSCSQTALTVAWVRKWVVLCLQFKLPQSGAVGFSPPLEGGVAMSINDIDLGLGECDKTVTFSEGSNADKTVPEGGHDTALLGYWWECR